MKVGAVISALPATWLNSHNPLTEQKRQKRAGVEAWGRELMPMRTSTEKVRGESEWVSLLWLYLFITICVAPCGSFWPSSFLPQPIAEGRRGLWPSSLSVLSNQICHPRLWAGCYALGQSNARGWDLQEYWYVWQELTELRRLQLCGTDTEAVISSHFKRSINQSVTSSNFVRHSLHVCDAEQQEECLPSDALCQLN